MVTKNIFIAHPETMAQVEAMSAFAIALNIQFEVSKGIAYDPAFVKRVLDGDKDFENGSFKIIKTEDLWK